MHPSEGPRPADPPFLFVMLLSARKSGDRMLESLARDWLAEVGIRVVFADELDSPQTARGWTVANMLPPAAQHTDTIAVDQVEAARLTKVSAKTLGRLADAGEPVGRIKVGRRVLFLRAALERWLASKVETEVRQ